MNKHGFLSRIALSTALAGVIVGAALIPQQVSAEQTQATAAAGALSTAARLDFSIVIPRFLRFRVGTAGGTIDLINFSPTAAVVGDSSVVAGTGGDATGGAVNVIVQANSGQVSITPTNNSGGTGLGDGAANFINYNEIITASNNAGTLPAPVLSNAGGTVTMPTLNAGSVTNRTGIWTYTYANTTVPASGTYGTSVNGGRVTYTAATP